MLIRNWILAAGTPADLSSAGSSADAIAIGCRKVRIVCDQCVLGVLGDVDNTAGVSLQNLLVKPVSNHNTTP